MKGTQKKGAESNSRGCSGALCKPSGNFWRIPRGAPAACTRQIQPHYSPLHRFTRQTRIVQRFPELRQSPPDAPRPNHQNNKVRRFLFRRLSANPQASIPPRVLGAVILISVVAALPGSKFKSKRPQRRTMRCSELLRASQPVLPPADLPPPPFRTGCAALRSR